MTNRLPGSDASRRAFLRTAALGGAAFVVAGGAATRWLTRRGTDRHWSDPVTWDGRTPAEDDVAFVSTRVFLDRDATVAGLVVEPGGALVFDPDSSRTLATRGNVVVRGTLSMEPASTRTVHRLVFRNVSEAAFVGGGMEVLKSDVGLWVMDNGSLRIAGSPKLAWSTAADALPVGSTEITLGDDPDGWEVGDELVIAPTLPPTNGGDSTRPEEAYDIATVSAISDRTVRLSSATRFPHPGVDVGGGSMTAEVLNLTRNVRIQGTEGGRSHVFIHSMRRQVVKNAALRYMGPRQRSEGHTVNVLGRYGLHFHMCRNGSRRSVVEGVVVRDCGGHAFVPHTSHGISFTDCISHNTFDEAFWWDGGDLTDDVILSRCVASLVRSDPSFRGYRLTGFALGKGVDNTVRDCVAVGIRGNENASGFLWDEGAEGVWTFEDCVAHNNAVNGIFVWQNTGKRHLIDRFVAYHNGKSGIEHGAYLNAYVFRDVSLVGNDEAGVILHAESMGPGELRFERPKVLGAGIQPVRVPRPGVPTRWWSGNDLRTIHLGSHGRRLRPGLLRRHDRGPIRGPRALLVSEHGR